MSVRARSPTKRGKKRQYVQFSKQMVCVVIGGAMAFTVATLAILFFGAESPAEVVKVYEGFMRFSSVVFGCYSGNSAYEKYVLNRYAEAGPTARRGTEVCRQTNAEAQSRQGRRIWAEADGEGDAEASSKSPNG